MTHDFPYEEFEQNGIAVFRPQPASHPLNNCGPMQIALERGDQCPTCGVAAGSEPTAEELEAVRKVWPHYPSGFWA